MASQTFAIGAHTDGSFSGDELFARFQPNLAIDSALLESDTGTGSLRYLQINAGVVSDYVELRTNGPDLNSSFETGGTLTLAAGGLSLVLNVSDFSFTDDTEPYTWSLSNEQYILVDNFIQGYGRLRPAQQAATILTLDDGVVASDAVAPTVTIDTIRDGDEGSTVQLSATLTGGTYDEVDYAWSVTGGTLDDGSSATPTLTHADVAADSNFVATLNITARGTGTVAVDGTSATASDTESFTTLNVVSTGLGDETLFTSLTILTSVFTDVQTGSSGGRWRYDSGGSSASAGTGPGSNNSLSFVHTETSSTSISQQAVAETRGLLVFASLPDETGRELHLRLSIQGGFGDGTEGLRVEYQEAGSQAWIEAEFFHGWDFSNSYTANQEITDENGVSRTIAVTGGWIDFETDIPDTAIEVRLAPKYIFRSGQNTYTHDIAMRSLQWEWDIAPIENEASLDSAGFGIASHSVSATKTEPDYSAGVNAVGFGFGSPSIGGGHSQTITIGPPNQFGNVNGMQWWWTSNPVAPPQNTDPLIDPELVEGGITAYLFSIQILDTSLFIADFRLSLEATYPGAGFGAMPDLTSAFESGGSITISAGGLSLSLQIDEAQTVDATEPYAWSFPTQQAEFRAFIEAYFVLSEAQKMGTTITIDDGVGPGIIKTEPDYSTGVNQAGYSFASSGVEATSVAQGFDASLDSVGYGFGSPSVSVVVDSPLSLLDSQPPVGQETVALALMEASGSGPTSDPWYRDSNRGGTDTPIDGELGLGPGETVISRIARVSSTVVLLNDNDSPVPLGLTEYFGASNSISEYTFYFQTLDGVISTNQLSTAGGNYVNWRFEDNAILSNLGVGDRFIIRFTRPPLLGSVDQSGYAFSSPSVSATKTEPGYSTGVNQAGYGFASSSVEVTVTIPGAGVGVNPAGFSFSSPSVGVAATVPGKDAGVNTAGYSFKVPSAEARAVEAGDGAVNPAGYSFASHPVGAVALEAGVVVYIPDIPRVTSISSNRGSVTRVMGNGRPRFHGVAKDSYTVLVEHFLITEAEAGRLRRFHEGNESGRVSIKAVDGATYVGRFKAPYGVIPIKGNYYTARVQLVCNRA